ncbi:MAG: hypothetical protein RL024_471 [Actinomycetota bacterium]|jgi:hypothetical protein
MQPTAEFILHSLVVLHFIGLASLLGGFLTQMKAMGKGLAVIVPAMVHGAWTMLLTGLLLVGVREWMAVMAWDDELNHMKIGVKSLIVTVILILVIHYKKKQTVSAKVFGAIGLLTILNVVLAVFW